jgi:predicted PurR-regulated permease PerM
MKVKIDIDTRTLARFWLVLIGFGVAGLLIFQARTALIIIGAAIFLALALNPSVNWIASILPGGKKRRGLSTAIAYVIVVVLLSAFVFLAVPPMVEQTGKVVAAIPQWVDTASKQYEGVNHFIQHYHLQGQVDNVVQSLKDNAAKIGSGIGTNLLTGIGSVLSFITAGILTLVIAFFILIEAPTWLRWIWSLYSDKPKMQYHRGVVRRLYSVVTGYVTGQLLVSALDGFWAGVAVFVLSLFFNVPASLAIPTAVIAFLFSLIPLFGATIGAIIVGLVIAFNSLTAAIIYIIFVIIYQQLESNFIVPRIQSKRLDLSALMVLVAVTIGIYLFGIVGGIISIPIAGCVKVLTEEYIAYFKAKNSTEVEVAAVKTKVED